MTSPKSIVIIGAGGFGRGTVDVVKAINSTSGAPLWNLIGIYDDNPSEINVRRMEKINVKYLGAVPRESQSDAVNYVVGINNPRVREEISTRLDGIGWTPTSLVHPDATIETTEGIGPGSIIRAGVRIASNSVIGRHVHLNFNVVLGHDVQLGDFVSVNPLASIAGEVSVGARTVIGTGSVVLQGKTLGGDSQVGASACVTKSYGVGSTLVGIPAKPVL